MKGSGILSALMIVGLSAPPVGAAVPCSIHPAPGTSDSQLQGLAKLSRSEAEKIAVSRLKSRRAVSVASGELEAEHGCLIWSFDLKVAGRSGLQEIQVDAGNGKVLSVKHETSKQESAERDSEKAQTSK